VTIRAALLFTLLVTLTFSATAQQAVTMPSLEQRDGVALPLTGLWFPAAADGNRPALVLFHGCGGMFNSRGLLTERMREYSALLNAEGWHVLVLDSLTPRGVKELCTVEMVKRSVDQNNRRQDALGALQWLAMQPGVDARRLALLGWSHGGSTVLAATNSRHPLVAQSAVKPTAAVAFYPGCAVEQDRGYAGTAPLLLMVGEADDWTPARPCRELAAQATSAVQFIAYPGAYHSFDGNTPQRVRKEVPNGVNPGQGVTVGGQPEAREASRKALIEFLRERLR
jgi:dienelactone hydrolase